MCKEMALHQLTQALCYLVGGLQKEEELTPEHIAEIVKGICVICDKMNEVANGR